MNRQGYLTFEDVIKISMVFVAILFIAYNFFLPTVMVSQPIPTALALVSELQDKFDNQARDLNICGDKLSRVDDFKYQERPSFATLIGSIFFTISVMVLFWALWYNFYYVEQIDKKKEIIERLYNERESLKAKLRRKK